MGLAILIVWVIILGIAILLIVSNIKIVPQAHAYVVERLGGYKETWGVGLHFKMPILDRVARISHRTRYIRRQMQRMPHSLTRQP